MLVCAGSRNGGSSELSYSGGTSAWYLRGKICLYNGSKAKYRDASAMLGYGLKTAKRPRRDVMTKSGCFLHMRYKHVVTEYAFLRRTLA